MKKSSGMLILSLLSLTILSSGCVSRRAYDENVSILIQRLNNQKADHNAEVRSLELKVQERGRSLSDITNRYMELKQQNDYSQSKLNNFQKDMDALLTDMAELKLVIFTNFKGSEANEMMLKITNMQKRIQELLKKSNEALTPGTPAQTDKIQPELNPADKL